MNPVTWEHLGSWERSRHLAQAKIPRTKQHKQRDQKTNKVTRFWTVSLNGVTLGRDGKLLQFRNKTAALAEGNATLKRLRVLTKPPRKIY